MYNTVSLSVNILHVYMQTKPTILTTLHTKYLALMMT